MEAQVPGAKADTAITSAVYDVAIESEMQGSFTDFSCSERFCRDVAAQEDVPEKIKGRQEESWRINLVKLEPCRSAVAEIEEWESVGWVTTDIEFVARSAEVSDLMYQ